MTRPISKRSLAIVASAIAEISSEGVRVIPRSDIDYHAARKGGISRITVTIALRQLERLGAIRRIARGAYTVIDTTILEEILSETGNT